MLSVINPHFTQFADFVKSIHYQFDKGGAVIFKQRNELRVFDVQGEPLNVKRFRAPHLFNRIIYTFFRKTKAQCSYQNALRLKELGIETPEPAAFILTKRNGLLSYSYYVSRQVAYNRNMYEFGEGGIEGREHILEAFVDFTVKMHEKGIYHKDFSPGNILFKEEKGEVTFCLVDINRMRFRPVTVLQGSANLARLWGQKPFFDFIVRRYAEKRHADAEKCLKVALQARKNFWKRYTRRHPLPFTWD